LALFIWGCPKRQPPPQVVYVPSPPVAATVEASAEPPETLVIEEPIAEEEPKAVSPESEAATPQPSPPRRRPVRTAPAGPAEAAVELAAPPAPEVPALQPRESPAQGAALRQQIVGLQQQVRQRIGRLDSRQLSPTDRKTLDDAGGFLDQSDKALEEGDLQRANTLARKASLLVSAVEQ